MTTPDIAALLPSWELALRAERKSPQTIKSYTTGVQQYFDGARASNYPSRRPQLARFTDYVLDHAQSATARARQLAVRRFSAWLVDESEIPTDLLLGVKSPKLESKVIEPLTDDQIKAMLKACVGADTHDRRHEALLRLMVETGIRAGEVAALRTADVDLKDEPPSCDEARAAGAASLRSDSRRAGIQGFHSHKLRHRAAHRWPAAGGSESGLMGGGRAGHAPAIHEGSGERESGRLACRLNLGDL